MKNNLLLFISLFAFTLISCDKIEKETWLYIQNESSYIINASFSKFKADQVLDTVNSSFSINVLDIGSIKGHHDVLTAIEQVQNSFELEIPELNKTVFFSKAKVENYAVNPFLSDEAWVESSEILDFPSNYSTQKVDAKQFIFVITDQELLGQ